MLIIHVNICFPIEKFYNFLAIHKERFLFNTNLKATFHLFLFSEMNDLIALIFSCCPPPSPYWSKGECLIPSIYQVTKCASNKHGGISDVRCSLHSMQRKGRLLNQNLLCSTFKMSMIFLEHDRQLRVYVPQRICLFLKTLA